MAKKPVSLQKDPQTPQKLPKQTATGVLSHIDAAAGTSLARDALGRERYLFLVRVTMFISVALAVSVLVNFYLAIRPTQFRYFTTDPSGGIHEIQALNRPIQSQELVLNWATTAVTRSYSLSFANYAQQLNDLKPFFNDSGWQGYKDALERANFIQNMLGNQYVTTAVPKAAPVILGQGNLNGVWAWRLQVPITVTYKSASVTSSQDITVEVIVVRRDETENPVGLGIAQIISQ